jgi:hypothetical protein
MQEKAKKTDTMCPDRGTEEELADVLTAISVVSKRLAKKLSRMAKQGEQEPEKGGKPIEQDE